MIVEIQKFIQDNLGGLLGTNPFHVVMIICTKPVFLVFTNQDAYPNLVLKIDETNVLTKSYQDMVQLRKSFGELVAEPVGLFPFQPTKSVSIQKGIQGTPWFRIKEIVPFETICKLSTQGLEELHSKVGGIREYQQEVAPALSLREITERLQTKNLIDPVLIERLYDATRRLEELGTIPSFRQHGDFCINNLMYADDHVYVIDFDDFGKTSVPLHDCFSLLRSLASIAPSPLTVQTYATVLTKYFNQLNLPGNLKEFVKELWLHQLVFFIEQCLLHSRPVEMQRLLLQLREVALDPDLGDQLRKLLWTAGTK